MIVETAKEVRLKKVADELKLYRCKTSSRMFSILLGEVLLFVSLIIIEFFNQKIKTKLVS